MSVNTDVLLGETSSDALADSQNDANVMEHLRSISIVIKCTQTAEGVLDEAGGNQHNIAKAAPNELKLGEGR